MSYTTNSSITRQDLDKASFSFSINNFPDAKRTKKKTGEFIKSDIFSIMASKFIIDVYPSGWSDEDSGFVSVFLHNVSDHTVTVNYTLTVGSEVSSGKSIEIKPKKGNGFPQFIKISEVGQKMEVTAQVTLVNEDILDEAVGGQSLASWQLGKKSEAENQQKLQLKLEQKLELKLEQKLELKLEQKLEKYVEKKLEKKLEEKMDDKLNQLDQKINMKFETLKLCLKDEMKQLDQKINMKFEDLKEDIKAPARAPECPICFEELRPPMRIIQCQKGHKLCEPCSQKPDIVSCPGACKSAFIGRDFGMEAFLLEQFKIRWVIKT